jgi:hypothetical protein
MTHSTYWWQRQTIKETFDRVQNGVSPWVAGGDFLDDWRRSVLEDRYELVENPIAPATTLETQRWAAFCAAMVEWLCWQDDLPTPTWTDQESYTLQDPWFLYEGKRLRAWQLVATAAPFKMRNIYGGDRMLERV